MRGKTWVITGLIALFLAFGLSCFAEDEENKEDKPDRLITMAVEYPGVVVPSDEEEISMDIIFHNRGRSDETVDVVLAEIPEGWKAQIKTYRFSVTGIHVPSDDNKTLTFEAEPGKDVKPGVYNFRIEAKTRDGVFQMSEIFSVTISEKESDDKKEKGVKLTTSYPVLRGPTDAKFEFSMEVDSKLEEDTIFDLFAKGPEGWDINFKPAYESKYISSVRLKGSQSQTVAVEVKPPATATAGEYPIQVRVSAGDARSEVELTVILTGTYTIEVGAINDLLSLEARQGKPANISIYVKNTGSAPNNDIKFMSFKPENWKVEFKPENIETLAAGDLKQVEVTITPNEEALVGDYSVAVRVEGEKAEKNIEFRVSVKASSAWAWIGIGIIVIVIGVLTALFGKLGRR